ncbi:immunoglobulin lambda-1 light chain-like [Xyrichtys novacula]|nr:immunoglobulin lambda-1 light chain-like [Xyrichtys novacula]
MWVTSASASSLMNPRIRQVFVRALLTVWLNTYYYIFGSGTTLFVSGEQVVEPVVRVYPAASRGQLLCVASGMFPPLVKFSWKRQKERDGVEVLPSADSRQQKLQETGCSASVLHINQQEISSDQYLCNVQHQGGTREVPAPTGNEGLMSALLMHQVKLLSLLYSLLIVKSLVYCCGLFLMTIFRDK